MPVKWTAEKDQTLLLKIIEVSNVSPDVRAISERWPNKDGEEKPTPRAITERLAKIRKEIRAMGGDMQIVGGRASAGQDRDGNGKDSTSAKPKAPRKPRAPKVKKEEPIVKQETNNAGFLNVATHLGAEHDLSEPDDVPQLDEGSSDAAPSPQQPATPASSKRKRSFPGLKMDDNDDEEGLFGLPMKKVKVPSPSGVNLLGVNVPYTSSYGTLNGYQHTNYHGIGDDEA